jgi:hypothetical protein
MSAPDSTTDPLHTLAFDFPPNERRFPLPGASPRFRATQALELPSTVTPSDVSGQRVITSEPSRGRASAARVRLKMMADAFNKSIYAINIQPKLSKFISGRGHTCADAGALPISIRPLTRMVNADDERRACNVVNQPRSFRGLRSLWQQTNFAHVNETSPSGTSRITHATRPTLTQAPLSNAQAEPCRRGRSPGKAAVCRLLDAAPGRATQCASA